MPEKSKLPSRRPDFGSQPVCTGIGRSAIGPHLIYLLRMENIFIFYYSRLLRHVKLWLNPLQMPTDPKENLLKPNNNIETGIFLSTYHQRTLPLLTSWAIQYSEPSKLDHFCPLSCHKFHRADESIVVYHRLNFVLLALNFKL